MEHYDLCVIGSGPAGQRAAVQAAKLGKRAAIIERREVVGGVAINTGTIPSKALREAVVHITGAERPGVRSGGVRVLNKDVTIEDLTYWCQQVIGKEIEVIRDQLQRNGVDLLRGSGSFVDEHTIEITHGSEKTQISADYVLIATGTHPARPEGIKFDSSHIVDADGVLNLPRLPRSMIIVGGGVIGTEYGSMLQALGVKVTLIEGRNKLLGFVDGEIGEALQYHLRQSGMTLRFNEQVVKVERMTAPAQSSANAGELVEATLESGKVLRAETLLYATGRQGCTVELNLAAVGLSADARGRIAVNKQYQTTQPHIYAAGDVIGFPALASTSAEQGRLSACHMFKYPSRTTPELFPFGIYAIPEISQVGWTEDQLTEQDVPYESGVANYREIARGQLVGDQIGMLKLLIHQETRHVLGVHCLGTGATEIVHIGQAVMALNGTVDYFIDTVFNYPTFAECYKVAALNAVNKLIHV